MLLVSLVLLRDPLLALREALSQAAGCAADPEILRITRTVLMQELVGLQLQMMEAAMRSPRRTSTKPVIRCSILRNGGQTWRQRNQPAQCRRAALGRARKEQ